jgi:hypothetical protein
VLARGDRAQNLVALRQNGRRRDGLLGRHMHHVDHGGRRAPERQLVDHGGKGAWALAEPTQRRSDAEAQKLLLGERGLRLAREACSRVHVGGVASEHLAGQGRGFRGDHRCLVVDSVRVRHRSPPCRGQFGRVAGL